MAFLNPGGVWEEEELNSEVGGGGASFGERSHEAPGNSSPLSRAWMLSSVGDGTGWAGTAAQPSQTHSWPGSSASGRWETPWNSHLCDVGGWGPGHSNEGIALPRPFS